MLLPVEFERCLERPALFRSGSFALHVRRSAASSGEVETDGGRPAWRLGLVIPKRHEASAVARNTIKRRWRDAFRRERDAWAREFGGADLVVRLQSPLVPKIAKPVARRGVAPAPVAPPVPARVRARDRFDPAALLAGLAARLRSRGAGTRPPGPRAAAPGRP